jgi:hypothetical protein
MNIISLNDTLVNMGSMDNIVFFIAYIRIAMVLLLLLAAYIVKKLIDKKI